MLTTAHLMKNQPGVVEGLSPLSNLALRLIRSFVNYLSLLTFAWVFLYQFCRISLCNLHCAVSFVAHKCHDPRESIRSLWKHYRACDESNSLPSLPRSFSYLHLLSETQLQTDAAEALARAAESAAVASKQDTPEFCRAQRLRLRANDLKEKLQDMQTEGLSTLDLPRQRTPDSPRQRSCSM